MNEESCDVDSDLGKEFCRVLYSADEGYQWGCEDSIYCEAYGLSDTCTHLTADLTYKDCDGNTVTGESFEAYYKCCEGDNCNHESLDIETCQDEGDDGYGPSQQALADCIYADNSAYREYVCADDVEEVSCDALTAIFKQNARCQCDYYSGLYNKVSSTSQTYLKTQVAELMAEFSEWNGITFGDDTEACTIEVSCDLEDGGIVFNGVDEGDSVAGRVYIFAGLWSLLIAYKMF